MRIGGSIRSQLNLLVLVVAVPLLGLVLYSSYLFARQQMVQVQGSALDLAELAAASTEQLLADSESVLAAIAQRPLVQAADPAQCDPILQEVSSVLPQYAGLGLTDASGQVICSSAAAAGAPLPSLGDRPYFQRLLQTRSFTVGEAQQGRITGRWTSVLAYPVESDGGDLVGALILPIDLVRYQSTLRDVFLPPGAAITILDSTGTVIASSAEPEIRVGQNVRGVEIVEMVLATTEGEANATGIDGGEKLYGFTTIPRAGWHVYTGIPIEEAQAPLVEGLIRQLLVSLGVIAAVTFLAVTAARQIDRPILSLAAVARDVAAGKTGQRVPATGPKEFHDVATAFNGMLDARARHIQQLERKTEQAETLSRRLRQLNKQVVSAQESERQRISRELHDEAGQILTALKITLSLVRSQLPEANESLRQELDAAIDLTDESMRQIRDLAHALRPPALERFGLDASLSSLCREFSERTRLFIEYDGDGAVPPLPDQLALTLYRFAQEALTNAAKHASASEIRVILQQQQESISLTVGDNGRGFPVHEVLSPLTSHIGIGLLGMQERLELVNGRLEIESEPGRGSRLTAVCPVVDTLVESR